MEHINLTDYSIDPPKNYEQCLVCGEDLNHKNRCPAKCTDDPDYPNSENIKEFVDDPTVTDKCPRCLENLEEDYCQECGFVNET